MTRSPMRRFRLLLLLCAIGSAHAALAQAPDNYPSRPVRLITNFAAGGAIDAVARAVGARLAETMGQPFVVDNRPGAGGTLGTEAAARSAANGYTLLLVSASYSVNPSLYQLAYDPLGELAPISLLASVPFVLVTSPSSGIDSVAQLIAIAKEKPGTINFASSGNGSAPHLAGEMLSLSTGMKMVHIPFKGGAPALTEVIAGRVQLLFSTVTQALPFIKGGKLKALAVSSRKRATALPDVPTVEESGVANFDIVDWFGVLAPKATTAPVLSKLSDEITRAVSSVDLKARLVAEGFDVIASTPEEFDRVLRRDMDMYGRVVKAANVKIE